MAELNRLEEWKPLMVMVAIDFALAIENILLKKVVDEGINHLVLFTYRLLIATILLAPIAYFWERESRSKISIRILVYLFFSAIVGASLTEYCFLLGIQYTSATFACAFVNMVPVATFLMALPLGLETLDIKCNSGRAKVVGALVCICGAAILTLYKGMPLFNSNQSQNLKHYSLKLRSNIAKNKREKWTIGSIALIVGTLLWSSWFLIQSNIGKRFPFQYSSTAIMSFFGALQSATLSFSTAPNFSSWSLKGKTEIMTVLYAGMVGSGLCFVGMSWCVKKRGPVFTAAFSPLVQIMVAIFDILILHEQLCLGSVLGSIIIIIGLYILLLGKKKEMKNCVMKLNQESNDEEKKEQIEKQTLN